MQQKLYEYFIFLFRAASFLPLLISFYSCVKEEAVLDEGSVMFTASFAENKTRTAVIDGGATVYWEVGDEINVFCGNGGGKFTADITEISTSTGFKGNLTNASFSGASVFYGLYPYSSDASFDGDCVTAVLPSCQTGRAGSFGKGCNISIARAKGFALGFYNACSGLRFSLANDGIKEVVLESLGGESIAGKVKFAFDGNTPAVKEVLEGSDRITLSAPDGGAFKKGEWYYITALPAALSRGFRLTFFTDLHHATMVSSSSRTFTRGVFGSLKEVDKSVSFGTGEDNDKSVDLGLSVKWAACNIGADKPEDCGGFYSWGEISVKSAYDWSSYRWCNGSNHTLTKYCSDNFYGSVDNLTVLELEDDIVRTTLGDGWRMPTDEEWTELRENCNWTWTVREGVGGYLVSGKKDGYTSSSIFLPACGYRGYGYHNGTGTNGLYWSSTLRTDLPYYAYYLDFTEKNVCNANYNRYYGLPVRAVSSITDKPEVSDCFCFTAEEAGVKISMSKHCYNTSSYLPAKSNAPDVCLVYSTNGVDWNNLIVGDGKGTQSDSTVIVLSHTGDKVYIKAGTDDNDFFASSGYNVAYPFLFRYWVYNSFMATGKISVGGNIMYLLNSQPLSSSLYENGEWMLPAELTFFRLFYGMHDLVEASNLILPANVMKGSSYCCMFSDCVNLREAPKLPATSLDVSCYADMFAGCSSLIKAPDLPSAVLSNGCYSGMFSGCVSLTEAPGLLATILDNYCYNGMFSGCKNLTKAPELPATALKHSCYRDMFSDCSSLVATPKLSATTLVDYCYKGMFSGCTSLSDITVLPASTMAVRCYDHMFSGCTNLTEAPGLPSEKLAKGCYGSMFSGCEKLICAPDLPAIELSDACYEYMFSGCSNLESAPRLPASTLVGQFSLHSTAGEMESLACYRGLFSNCPKLSSVYMLATDIPSNECMGSWLENSGIDSSVRSRIVWVSEDVTDATFSVIESSCPKGTYAWEVRRITKEGYPESEFAVDLGLSVKWATCNVGASKPEEYGDYYAWGGTETKSTYDWSTYKWGTEKSLTKYCTDSSYGIVDNKTILDSEDDVANLKWGGKWRMPTYKEWKELFDNCTITETNENGVDGYLVTSNIDGYTDKAIFLPYGSCYKGGELKELYLNYWSSAIDPSWLTNAYATEYGSYISSKFSERYLGLNVRPVYGDFVAVDHITLSSSTVTLASGQSCAMSVKIYPDNASENVYFWKNSDRNVVRLEGGRLYALKEGKCKITCFSGSVSSECPITVTPAEKPCPEAVDLGLNVKWATFNVGASKPEDVGGYYAWGEVETKDSYDRDNYKWCAASTNKFTKYCPSDKVDYWYNYSAGTNDPDNFLTLESCDDVAADEWGEKWRIPTDADWVELKNNCTWTWTQKNGVPGMAITSKKAGYTDKSIFLPAAGFRFDNELRNPSYYGFYWSASIYSNYPDEAWSIVFDSHYSASLKKESRKYGLSVRPVSE